MEKSEIKGFIAKRVAKELKDGDVVNLGIGLPTLVPAYLPEGVHVILQSENGIIGTGAKPTGADAEPAYKTDAGGSPAQAAKGGCYIDSATSFAFIRGGHVNATILGGLEVDQEGSSPARRCLVWAAPWTCWWAPRKSSWPWSTPPRATPKS